MRINPKSKQPYAIVLKDESNVRVRGAVGIVERQRKHRTRVHIDIVATDPDEIVEPSYIGWHRSIPPTYPLISYGHFPQT